MLPLAKAGVERQPSPEIAAISIEVVTLPICHKIRHGVTLPICHGIQVTVMQIGKVTPIVWSYGVAK